MSSSEQNDSPPGGLVPFASTNTRTNFDFSVNFYVTIIHFLFDKLIPKGYRLSYLLYFNNLTCKLFKN